MKSKLQPNDFDPENWEDMKSRSTVGIRINIDSRSEEEVRKFFILYITNCEFPNEWLKEVVSLHYTQYINLLDKLLLLQ